LVQHLVGSRREMAQSWADDHFFPMSYHDRINLPQVAQYLMVNRCDRSPTDLPPECKDVHPQMRTLCAELSRNLRSYIRTRYRNRMPRNTKDWPLSRVFSWAGREEIESNDQEPHRILADLELPLYVTANQNLLLEDALCRHGPELNEVWERLGQDREQPFFYPTQVRNRVHHVFGDMDHIQDIVLTEDDYFEFLMSAFREGGRVPYRIQSTLSRSSLLFLGFRLYHWDFRVLFQFIKEIGGSALLQGRPHVAVQIDPDDDYIVDPERARRYLECYFDEDGTDEKPKPRKPNLQMSIFWGTPVDFLRTLQERR
ncbi:MAG: SIR2 family protein, partial [Pseudomonadota bacterium]|nr:SIR2 family protein [Pseudomonadota bacterium]